MRFIAAGMAVGLLACFTPFASGQVARTPAASTASLETIRVKGFVSPSRVEIDRPVVVDVILQNLGRTTVSQVKVDLPQFTLGESDRLNLSGLVVPPGGRLLRRITVVPRQLGPFDVEVQLTSPGDAVLELIARLEVTAPAGFWSTYGQSVVTVGLAFLAAAVTVGVQMFVLRSTKRQKAAESVVQIIISQGRDYYFALSGALKNLVKTLEALPTTPQGPERDHLVRRAFFFFGIFTYKENEFAFNHGFLFLGHLWGELAVRRIVDKIATLVPLARADEAIIHKCFSDMWRVHLGSAGRDSAQLFSVRTLYDLERLLEKPGWRRSGPEEELQRAYAAVTPHLLHPETLERLRSLAKDLSSILEYEFTKLFQDWYAGAKGQRQMPRKAPPDFNDIVEGPPRWDQIRSSVEGS